MRAIVCGGRSFINARYVWKRLNEFRVLYNITEIAQGGAIGVDDAADKWAKDKGIQSITYYANWDKYGGRAGPLRNKEMLEEFKPDIVIAFPGSSGTAHMVFIAEEAGIKVIKAYNDSKAYLST